MIIVIWFLASQIYNPVLYLPNKFFTTYQPIVKFSKNIFKVLKIRDVAFVI